ncbi:MAG: ATP-binding protein [Bacteroidota bacterium]
MITSKKLKTRPKKRLVVSLLLAILLFWLANFLQHHVHFNDIEPKDTQKAIQATISAKEKEMKAALMKAKDIVLKDQWILYNNDFHKKLDTIVSKDFSILYFNVGGDLLYWSDAQTAFEETMDSVFAGKSFFKLKNGWYLAQNVIDREHVFIALFPIKSDYSIQNKYLVNDFNPALNIPTGSELLPVIKPNETTFFDDKNEAIFSIKLPINGSQSSEPSLFVMLVYILSLCFLTMAIVTLGKLLSSYRFSNASLLFFTLMIIGLRYLSIVYKFPAILSTQRIFDPHYFASSSILNSLGDFFINAVIVFYLVTLLATRWRTDVSVKFISSNRIWSYSFTLIAFSLLIEAAGFINYLVYGLIINSSISYNIKNVFELNNFSLFSFIIMALMLMSFYVITVSLIKFIRQLKIKIVHLVMVLSASIFLKFIINSSNRFFDLYTIAFALLMMMAVYVFNLKRKQLPNYSIYLFLIFIFSIFSTLKISEYSDLKEKNNRIILAGKIDKQRDYIAEHIFEDINEKVSKDTLVSSFFSHRHKNDNEIERIFRQNYFTGYWNRYDVIIDEFNAKGKVLWDTALLGMNLGHFDSLINLQGSETFCPNLFFVNNSSGRTSYLARISVMDNKNKSRKRATLIIQINSKYVQERNGFPELLLTDKITFSKEFSKYSYARYKDGILVNQNGDYPYSFQIAPFGNPTNDAIFIDKDKYNHLVYKVNSTTTVVMSKRNDGVIDFITLLSYMIALFCAFILSLLIIKNVSKGITNIDFNFNRRIQVAMVGLILFSLLIIGGATIYYIISNYNSQQFKQISDNITSLLVNIESEINNEKNIHVIKDEILPGLPKPGNITNLDYNIYDKTGNLVYSTQPKLIDEGIISSKINPLAYFELTSNLKTRYIHNEHLGKLDYIAAYEPIRNQDNKIIGYLDLPYFANQAELDNEISSFLVTLINFYVLLCVMAITLALPLANKITKPLRDISNGLRGIKLGHRNKLIEVRRKDEIGDLVNEYNRMVEALAVSAEKLAKSERESAWREMAKQVAHEIKNPLTPMKLSIQHLERAWSNDPEKMKEMIAKTSKILIEQIDTLANIATEFSNFAMMPKVNFEFIDLAVIIESVYHLYKESEGIKIVYSIYLPDNLSQENRKLNVYADKEQLIRIFSNLIKNAIQAIPEDVKGIINITLTEDPSNYIVSISDNGIGIRDEEKDKIFVPNFTTKTTGMGLGLAIVKSSIENIDGKVWFESKLNYGTTFFVSLPKKL